MRTRGWMGAAAALVAAHGFGTRPPLAEATRHAGSSPSVTADRASVACGPRGAIAFATPLTVPPTGRSELGRYYRYDRRFVVASYCTCTAQYWRRGGRQGASHGGAHVNQHAADVQSSSSSIAGGAEARVGATLGNVTARPFEDTARMNTKRTTQVATRVHLNCR